jgi:hypothetical protein
MVCNILQSMEKSLQNLQHLIQALGASQQPSFAKGVGNGPHEQQQWRPVDPTLKAQRMEIAKARVESIKQASKMHPHCLKCGDRGHPAQSCRNATMCFVCKKLGHKFFQCRSAAPQFKAKPLGASISSDQVTPPN